MTIQLIPVIPEEQHWKTGILRMLLPKSNKAATHFPAQSSSHSLFKGCCRHVPCFSRGNKMCWALLPRLGYWAWGILLERAGDSYLPFCWVWSCYQLVHCAVLSPYLALQAPYPRAPGPCFSFPLPGNSQPPAGSAPVPYIHKLPN